MNHTKTQQVLPIKILEAAYRYLLPSTAVQAQKSKMFRAFSWAKNTARRVRFLLRFSLYLFLAQSEQVHLFGAFTDI